MRPARRCRCRKAFFAAPAGRPIPRVGDAARTADSTKCGPVRMDRSASTCSGRFRSSSSGQGRRTSAGPARAVAALHGRTPSRNNSASVAATVVRNGRSSVRIGLRKAAASNRNALLSSSRPYPKLTDSVRDGVAVGGVEAAAVSPLRTRTLLRVRTRRCSNRGRRVSRDLPVRRRCRVPIRRSRARKAESLVPREMVRNGADVSGGGAAVVADRRAGPRAGPRQLERIEAAIKVPARQKRLDEDGGRALGNQRRRPCRPGYVVSSVAVAEACATTLGRLSRRCRAVHSAKPSQRMQ
jgi:hypothetical protein